jgi:hypothetical protein
VYDRHVDTDTAYFQLAAQGCQSNVEAHNVTERDMRDAEETHDKPRHPLSLWNAVGMNRLEYMENAVGMNSLEYTGNCEVSRKTWQDLDQYSNVRIIKARTQPAKQEAGELSRVQTQMQVETKMKIWKVSPEQEVAEKQMQFNDERRIAQVVIHDQATNDQTNDHSFEHNCTMFESDDEQENLEELKMAQAQVRQIVEELLQLKYNTEAELYASLDGYIEKMRMFEEDQKQEYRNKAMRKEKQDLSLQQAQRNLLSARRAKLDALYPNTKNAKPSSPQQSNIEIVGKGRRRRVKSIQQKVLEEPEPEFEVLMDKV